MKRFVASLVVFAMSCGSPSGRQEPETQQPEQATSESPYFVQILNVRYAEVVSDLVAAYPELNQIGCNEHEAMARAKDPRLSAMRSAQSKVLIARELAVSTVHGNHLVAAVSSSRLSTDVDVAKNAVFGCYEGVEQICVRSAASRALTDYIKPIQENSPESMLHVLSQVVSGIRDEHHQLALDFGAEVGRGCEPHSPPDWEVFLRGSDL